MKVFFKITDNGYPICIKQYKKEIKYVNSTHEAYKILKNKDNIKNVTIIDNKICFKLDGKIINIEPANEVSYDNSLNSLIKHCIILKKEAERKFLRNKKIKRILPKVIAAVGASVLISAILTNIYLNNENKKIKKAKELNNKKEYEQSINEFEKEDINLVYNEERTIDVDYADRTDTDKYIYTKEKYFDKIKRISEKYSVPPQIMLAIATQETGGDERYFNDYGKGLMQLEASAWNNEILKAFNTEINEYETIKVDVNKLMNLDYNIKVACMFFQNCLTLSNYNLDIAIQLYNYGYGNMTKVLRCANNNYNLSFSECMKNYVSNWKDYRNIVNSGDSLYLEHVLSYVENDNVELKKINSSEQISYNIRKKSHNLTI